MWARIIQLTTNGSCCISQGSYSPDVIKNSYESNSSNIYDNRMDLLGDLGEQDQLTAARAENKVLHDKVHELTERLHQVTTDKELLQIELEECQEQLMQRKSGTNDASLSLTNAINNHTTASPETSFLTSGSGIYPTMCRLSLLRLHGGCNVSCCAIQGAVVATGGANNMLSLCVWNRDHDEAVQHDATAADLDQQQYTLHISCDAPVVSVAFSHTLRNVVAAGCMDGSVRLVQYEHHAFSSKPMLQLTCVTMAPRQHQKYVRTLAWHTSRHLLASASADGTVHVYRVNKILAGAASASNAGNEQHEVGGSCISNETIQCEFIKSLHLPGSVEAMTFIKDSLVVHARDTSYLQYFDASDEFAPSRRVSLNESAHDDHVSFCVLHLQPSHNQKYLAAATDGSCNLILDAVSGRRVRSLHGHESNSYSQPKVAWSANDEYLLGNTQDSGNVVVWDIATSRIVEQLEGHGQPVRDLMCDEHDCLVTTSYDKNTKLWCRSDEEH
ncbi:hypothetical protein MPSEU_000552800 [Mayamaea pseudoterrestris]|nr:hypothetical protein MPSEU_000552800 [Mayamaea pseudoterrestris]